MQIYFLQGLNPSESSPHRVAKCLTFSGPSVRTMDRTRNPMRQSSTAPTMLMHEIRKLEHMQEQLGEEANRALEVLQKEVACHRLGNQDAAETIAKLQAEIKEMRSVRSLTKEVNVVNVNPGANLKEEITRLHSQGSTIADLEQQLENVQKSIDKLVMSLPSNIQSDETCAKSSSKTHSKKKKMLPLNLSTNINRPHLIRSPCSPLSSSRNVLESEVENRTPEENISHEVVVTSEKATPPKSEDGGETSSRESTPCHQRSGSVNMRKMQKMFQNAAEENVRSIKAYVTELKERVAKLQYQKQLLVCQVRKVFLTLSIISLIRFLIILLSVSLCDGLSILLIFMFLFQHYSSARVCKNIADHHTL